MKEMPRMKKGVITLITLLSCLIVQTRSRCFATSYSVTVPHLTQNANGSWGGGMFFAAYHFSAATIHNVFPPNSLPWWTQMDFWNNATQSYTVVTLDQFAGDWDNPTFQLQPGMVFFIVNPSTNLNMTVTISGTDPVGQQSISIVAGKWISAAAPKYPTAVALECPCPYSSNMSYPGTDGDQLVWWNPDIQAWDTSQVRLPVAGAPSSWSGYCGGGVIPFPYSFNGNGNYVTQPGWGGFLKSGVSKTWNYSVVTCP
jgi:hypothetical protein